MNSVRLMMPVTVKAKLTEKLRARLIDECNRMAEQMSLEIRQIEIDRHVDTKGQPSAIHTETIVHPYR